MTDFDAAFLRLADAVRGAGGPRGGIYIDADGMSLKLAPPDGPPILLIAANIADQPRMDKAVADMVDGARRKRA